MLDGHFKFKIWDPEIYKLCWNFLRCLRGSLNSLFCEICKSQSEPNVKLCHQIRTMFEDKPTLAWLHVSILVVSKQNGCHFFSKTKAPEKDVGFFCDLVHQLFLKIIVQPQVCPFPALQKKYYFEHRYRKAILNAHMGKYSNHYVFICNRNPWICL